MLVFPNSRRGVAIIRERRPIERIRYVSILALRTRGGRLTYIYIIRTLHHTDLGCQ